MRKTFTLILLCTLSAISQAKHIDQTTAELVAKNFLLTRTTSASLHNAASQLTAVYTGSSSASLIPSSNNADYFYIFNAGQSKGFVIVSADDNVIPVLGYSDEKPFDPAHTPRTVAKWLDNYKSQINYVLNNGITQTADIKNQWQSLINGTAPNGSLRSTNAVAPLVQTTWDQPYPYNTSCPYDAASAQNCVTGCPATAMAQILKYYGYPNQGSGIHSYNCANYGTLTANFGSTTYNWASMPNSISTPSTDIDQLMFQCGVAVEMNYGVQESSGFVITADNAVCCQSAYTTYFGYNANTIQGLQRANYTDANWTSMLQAELDASRVIQYAGFGSGGGHTWVCDGYDANGMFHMNWGWSGADDGYFDINALNPGTLGTGGGNGGFNSGEEALIGIEPITGGGTTAGGMAMNSVITVSPDPISFAQQFTVNADLINNGSAAFNGDYCAALFDASGTFITYIGAVLSTGSNPLPAGYHYTGGLTFLDTNGTVAVPGTYTIGIYYRTTGGNWYLATPGAYTNPITVTIAGPSNPLGIDLYSTLTPTGTFVQGQSGSVTANIANAGASTYTGTYGVALYDIAGNYVQTIGTYSETSGLLAGDDYTSPLTFGPATITATPGTYILGLLEEATGTSNYYLAGSNYFSNPMTVNVVAPPLQPDIYEPDNTIDSAYVLSMSFNNNAAYVSTPGSNIHSSTDIDYYRIDLPAGYFYTFHPQIDNTNYNTQNYTLDGLAAYSFDAGATWSNSFTGLVTPFTLAGGQSVYFVGASYFVGETGTYLLEMNIYRSLTGVQGINDINADEVSLYPNPTNTKVTISSVSNEPMIVAFYDITGQEVMIAETTGQTTTMDVSHLSKGVYLVKMKTTNSTFTKKLIIS